MEDIRSYESEMQDETNRLVTATSDSTTTLSSTLEPPQTALSAVAASGGGSDAEANNTCTPVSLNADLCQISDAETHTQDS